MVEQQELPVPHAAGNTETADHMHSGNPNALAVEQDGKEDGLRRDALQRAYVVALAVVVSERFPRPGRP
jgi:hypothetical protein